MLWTLVVLAVILASDLTIQLFALPLGQKVAVDPNAINLVPLSGSLGPIRLRLIPGDRDNEADKIEITVEGPHAVGEQYLQVTLANREFEYWNPDIDAMVTSEKEFDWEGFCSALQIGDVQVTCDATSGELYELFHAIQQIGTESRFEPIEAGTPSFSLNTVELRSMLRPARPSWLSYMELLLGLLIWLVGYFAFCRNVNWKRR